MGVDAVVSLVSLFGPKLIDIAKGWFGRKNTPEQTINTLASTDPEALTAYMNALTELVKARSVQFNQDISGKVAVWLNTWRGAIRPGVVTFAFIHIGLITLFKGPEGIALIPEWWRYVYEVAVASWFGDRWKAGI